MARDLRFASELLQSRRANTDPDVIKFFELHLLASKLVLGLPLSAQEERLVGEDGMGTRAERDQRIRTHMTAVLEVGVGRLETWRAINRSGYIATVLDPEVVEKAQPRSSMMKIRKVGRTVVAGGLVLAIAAPTTSSELARELPGFWGRQATNMSLTSSRFCLRMVAAYKPWEKGADGEEYAWKLITWEQQLQASQSPERRTADLGMLYSLYESLAGDPAGQYQSILWHRLAHQWESEDRPEKARNAWLRALGTVKTNDEEDIIALHYASFLESLGEQSKAREVLAQRAGKAEFTLSTGRLAQQLFDQADFDTLHSTLLPLDQSDLPPQLEVLLGIAEVRTNRADSGAPRLRALLTRLKEQDDKGLAELYLADGLRLTGQSPKNFASLYYEGFVSLIRVDRGLPPTEVAHHAANLAEAASQLSQTHPTDPRAALWLALAELLLGNHQPAHEALQEFLQSGSSYDRDIVRLVAQALDSGSQLQSSPVD